MSKTIVVTGFGPGISTAVAEKFGSEGFSVALVGRSEQRLAAGVESLKAKGIAAGAFAADAGDPTAIRGALAQARAALGPITVLHWNAFGGREATNFLTADAATIRGVFDVAIIGLLAAVQEALPDLRSTREGAVLVTNGAFGVVSPQIDALALALSASGVALANAAKHKLVGLLSEQLKADGVYVGEVMVAGGIKGTPTGGDDGIPGAKVADKFWELYQTRGEIRAQIS